MRVKFFLIRTLKVHRFFSLIGSFSFGLSSIMRVYPVLLKLASAKKTSCVPEMGCFMANSQAALTVLFTESKDFFLISGVILNGTVLLKAFRRG